MFAWALIIVATSFIVVGAMAKLVQIVTGRAWCSGCRRTLHTGTTICPGCEQTQPWAGTGRNARRRSGERAA